MAEEPAVEAIESVCMRPEEREFDAGALTRAEFATLLFSAKEAFYKCMQPLTRVAFDFPDVTLTRIDPAAQRLELRLLRAATAEFGPGHLFQCGYRSAQGHVYTALEIGH
ncbi:4'-phosphopantetheinyl transferase superfamily protein [Achromobacter ruhlandii]|uniref:4'-phosphopantetheinyl transferase superfamily protein n=1 Tax=Achromobacter ruhlandii TaxID=72557 RepID=UPI0035B56378